MGGEFPIPKGIPPAPSVEMADAVTRELELLLRERAEAKGENHRANGWLFTAFQKALADPGTMAESILPLLRMAVEGGAKIEAGGAARVEGGGQ